jgi:hypothetical protein
MQEKGEEKRKEMKYMQINYKNVMYEYSYERCQHYIYTVFKQYFVDPLPVLNELFTHIFVGIFKNQSKIILF